MDERDTQIKNMNDALNAIHDEAVRLLAKTDSSDVNGGLNLIISLARYKHDVRSQKEKDKK